MELRLYKKICPVCGKEFMSTAKNKRYCSEECYKNYTRKYNREYNQKHYKKVKSETGKKKKVSRMSMSEIEEEARKVGMRYGLYVALHNL